MDIHIIWLIKVLLAHLVTDFVLQPGSWIESRNRKHFLSPYLYLHGLVTAVGVLMLIGTHYWIAVLVIGLTHILIDGWKSYRPAQTKYFLIDQGLHLLVLLACWYSIFFQRNDIAHAITQLNSRRWLVLITAFVFVTQPAAIFISQLTKKWRDQIDDGITLGNAGKWIGIIERVIILALVLNTQYEAMGLLIAAKSLLRFNEANRPEIKTEYLLIGTLISVSLATLTGLLALKLISWH